MKWIVLLLILLILCGGSLLAQRSTDSFYDIQENSLGNIVFKSTNYGIFGHDVTNGTSGTIWKRGSTNKNRYIYGGGMWFGAMKTVGNTPEKLCLLSYNPNTGVSWMSPSAYPTCKNHHDSVKYSHLYYSTDFDLNGNPVSVVDSFGAYRWPIYKKDNQSNFGEFIADPSLRNSSSGKAHFVSAEDVISVYNDGNLQKYEDGNTIRQSQGYPLGINIVQRTYFFDKLPLEDVVILRYECTHTGSDTLKLCWFAPVLDMDIGRIVNSYGYNSIEKYYTQDSSLGLAYGWTPSKSSSNYDLGYVGYAFLETPSTDDKGNLSKNPDKQLDLRTYRTWTIADDPKDNGSRYDYMSTQKLDSESAHGDNRSLLSTGPFTMLPGETTVISFALMFANTASGGDATGTNADVAKLVQLCRDTKAAYTKFITDGNFLNVHEDVRADIHSLYPNPTTGVTTVEYTVTPTSMVTVEVFDMMTNRVALIEKASKSAGTYRTSFDTQSLPAGVYYFRIDAGGALTLKKFLVVR